MSSLCPTFNFKPFDLIDYVWTKQQDTIKSLICVQQRTESHTVFGLHEFILLGEQTSWDTCMQNTILWLLNS